MKLSEVTLYLCLGQDDKVELRPLLRAGISDAELKQVIVESILKKPERHEFSCDRLVCDDGIFAISGVVY